MIPYQEIINKYYPAGSALRDIYLRHCQSVADEAMAIARRCRLPLDEERIKAAAMLHDIGIFQTNAPDIQCRGSQPYICHGVIGRQLLKELGIDDEISEVAARHTGAGITRQEIADQHLPLPDEDFCPQTLLERLICYADKFYSKSGDMKKKDFNRVLKSMEKFGADSVERFLAMHREFRH